MKVSAIAPANIAFIKYWGKTDANNRVPGNNSISMNLSEMQTVTTVEFQPYLSSDDITFQNEDAVYAKEKERISGALDRVRILAQTSLRAKLVTKNSFPKAVGIASSASGFSSLAMAALGSLDIRLKPHELSKFCRLMSGTAARSVPDGFVEWLKGSGASDSFAVSLHPADFWDICDVVCIVSSEMKKVSSSDGHLLAKTSPFYNNRIKGMKAKIINIKDALNRKNFSRFGRILEDEALSMHAICITSTPPLLYWEPATLAVMKKVIWLREKGELESYFTIDAGPSVHVICQAAEAARLSLTLSGIPGVQRTVVNHPARGVHITNKHLF